jgi:predicted aspartyl protease
LSETRHTYDAALDPPAPILPLRLSAPGDPQGVLLPMLLDTGADCTLVPARIARELRLPWVDRLALSGVGGGTRQANVHAAYVELAGTRFLARVVAFQGEAILGRDVLNTLVAHLDGPALSFTLSTGRE